MDCLSDDVLRSFVDRELDPADLALVEKHLSECPACQTRAAELSSAALRVNEHLGSLEDSRHAVTEENPQIALTRFKANLPQEPDRVPFFGRIFAGRWRFAWAGSLAAAILLISLAFPSARSFAQRLLSTLRVEKVQTVPVDFAGFNGPRDRVVQDAVGKMLSDDVVVTTNEKSLTASSKQDASKLAGFPMRLPAGLTEAPQFNVAGAHAFHMAIDRARLQDILDQAGRTDLILPASLDGATFSVQVPRSVHTAYGNCPHHDAENGQQPPAPSPTVATNCVFLIQAPSPTVNVPENLNLQQLAETALQLTGMSPTQARQFSQTVDWRSTLVLPVPSSVQSYESVAVDGVQGTMMQTNARRGNGPSYAVIWVKGGIIYALFTTGDSNSALQLANSLE
ncbi:MAG TPA: zf-HC2 domain-containing protein [Candidatus Acidoferrum sp.]